MHLGGIADVRYAGEMHRGESQAAEAAASARALAGRREAGNAAKMRGMEPLPPEAFLAGYPEPMREIGEWLRSVVRRAVPDAIERVRPGWRLIGYDLPVTQRRSAYFSFIAPEPIHIHLGFEHGILMRDPRGLLAGAGITRQVRWVTLTPDHLLPEADLVELLLESARVASLSRGERFAIARSHDEAGPG